MILVIIFFLCVLIGVSVYLIYDDPHIEIGKLILHGNALGRALLTTTIVYTILWGIISIYTP